MTRLDDICDAFNNNDWLELHLIGGEFECAHLTDKAKRQIKDVLLELVGEDDWTDSEVRKYQVELRKKISEQ